MNTPSEAGSLTPGPWKLERWEGQDFIITGLGLEHPGTLSRHEGEIALQLLRLATPLIRRDATAELLDFAQAVARSACLQQFSGDECICYSCKAKAAIRKASHDI